MPFRQVTALAVLAFLAHTSLVRADTPSLQDACVALGTVPDITKATFVPAGPLNFAGPPAVSIMAPDHCLVQGALAPHTGIDGKPYAIGFELRLPANWNGKFVFQGGGGSDGVLRPAIGIQATGDVPALAKGYAIASTDAGHRDEPGPVGAFLFGLDPQARIDKGYNHIPVVTSKAEALIQKVYGRAQTRAYFVGCSNGGRQGMAASQRYPALFDGVVAGAPAYRVPRAALDAIHEVQMLAAIAPTGTDGRPDLGAALLPDDLKLIAAKILDSCDAADGLADGMINNVKACRFDIASLACKDGKTDACLAPAKARAVDAIFKGAHTTTGALIYSDWPYDPGIASPGWAAWRTGTAGKIPPDARNTTLIPGSIAYYFSSPPDKPTDLYDYTLHYNLDRGVKAIEATSPPFDESGWSIEAAPSSGIDAFTAHGGKMIFFHGMADPIFSARDTMAYVDALSQRYGASKIAQLYLVPGMTHCTGGPSTDQFDALTALDNWVDKQQVPGALVAKARPVPDVPWPGRTRPLCPYPSFASYSGSGGIEEASSFTCKQP